MDNWKLHLHLPEDAIETYRCGLHAGQRVALRKDLAIRDHDGKPTGQVHPKGEQWIVLAGTKTDSVLWFRQPDGRPHTWDDDAKSVTEWFELVDELHD